MAGNLTAKGGNMTSGATPREVTQGATSATKENKWKPVVRIADDGEVVRLTTGKTLGKVVDIGVKFVFKASADGQLSEEENGAVAHIVDMLNDRNNNDFWQERDAEVEASLAHLDHETRSSQRALKLLLGDAYLTEEEVRWSVMQVPKDVGDAIVDLWKEGKLVPRRNEYGEILWGAAGS
jgi:hypothetical protein